jgi:hypothetical protein
MKRAEHVAMKMFGRLTWKEIGLRGQHRALLVVHQGYPCIMMCEEPATVQKFGGGFLAIVSSQD